MSNNDVLRSVRYILNVGHESLAAIIGLGGVRVSAADVAAFLERDSEPAYRFCEDRVLASFLDGLVIHRRGRRDSPEPRPETTISNNTVLKRLRVAFELRQEDLVTMMTSVGISVSSGEVTALFRHPGHQNYRPCGDQFLRKFLKALTVRIRSPERLSGKES